MRHVVRPHHIALSAALALAGCDGDVGGDPARHASAERQGIEGKVYQQVGDFGEFGAPTGETFDLDTDVLIVSGAVPHQAFAVAELQSMFTVEIVRSTVESGYRANVPPGTYTVFGVIDGEPYQATTQPGPTPGSADTYERIEVDEGAYTHFDVEDARQASF